MVAHRDHEYKLIPNEAVIFGATLHKKAEKMISLLTNQEVPVIRQ